MYRWVLLRASSRLWRLWQGWSECVMLLLPMQVWPSWSSGDEQFWDHEWERHGTCAATVIRGGQHAFFQTVLRLYNTINVLVSGCSLYTIRATTGCPLASWHLQAA
jgi:hypothetical protein